MNSKQRRKHNRQFDDEIINNIPRGIRIQHYMRNPPIIEIYVGTKHRVSIVVPNNSFYKKRNFQELLIGKTVKQARQFIHHKSIEELQTLLLLQRNNVNKAEFTWHLMEDHNE